MAHGILAANLAHHGMKIRRGLLITGSGLFLLLGLFPPWRVTLKDQIGHTRAYITSQFILDDPRPAGSYGSSTIALDILLLEWVCLAAAILTVHLCFPPKGQT